MEIKPLRGFEHYLSIEDENTVKSIALLEKDYQLVLNLDNLYNTCLNITLPDEANLKIPAFLNLISHQEFYSGMAAFLRLHKAQSFRCLRAALDSSFTAYYLLKNPDQIEDYLGKARNPHKWEALFRNIKGTIRNNQKVFPLAVGLPEIHDLCSKFAHADPEGIFHKFFMDRKGQRLYAHFFDYERTHDDYRKWFTLLLYAFFKIFLIYWNEMLRDKAGQRKKEIEILIREFRANITVLRKRYPVS